MIIKKRFLVLLMMNLVINLSCVNSNNNTKLNQNIEVERNHTPPPSEVMIAVDTSDYKVKFITFKELLKQNPEYIKAQGWNLPDGLNRGTVVDIQFIDKKTNSVIKEYNPEKESPFADLPYTVRARDFDAGYIYVIQPEDKFQERLPYKKRNLSYVRDYRVTEIRTNYYVEVTPNKSHFAIMYRVEYYNKDYQLLGVNGVIRVLDNQGNVIGEVNNINTDLGHCVSTEDGKSVAFLRGGYLNEELEALDKEAIEIYDVLSNTKIGQIEADEKHKMAGVASVGNMFITEKMTLNNDMFELHIIEPESKKDFSRQFSEVERGRLKQVDVSGLIFNDNNEKQIKYEFKKDFQILNIEEK